MRLRFLFIALALGFTALQNADVPLGVYGDTNNILVMSEEPRIFLIRNFLSSEECDHLINRAKPALKRSMVVSDGLENRNVNQLHEARTSEGMFFEKSSKDPVLNRIEKRIAELTHLQQDHGEGMQVLHYGVGAEYQPHYDYFDRNTPGGRACYNRGGQRVASMIIYLADTEKGGETIFPYLDIAIKPVRGDAVLFYNCTLDGQEDPLTLHGSAPVIKGEKWVAVKWLRQGKFF